MNKILFTPEVLQYSKNLMQILYDKGYFVFKESAKKYVDELVYDIKTKLPAKPKKPAPKYFTDRYGKELYYATFTKSKRTQW